MDRQGLGDRAREVAVRLGRRGGSGSVPFPAGVCRAPFSSMYLDQHGSVRACCQNVEHPLGNIAEQRLLDIWHSRAADVLRDAMLEHDLSLGCAFCQWQEAEENDGLTFARTFDHLELATTEVGWPKQLELSLSNACNLQCVMCNGDWSSSIRTHRERRPPLPVVYDDRFFEDLRPFLEHVEVVKFLGGEPFLGSESLRVMDMLIEQEHTPEVHVTTNGTQWSPRVERILEQLPMGIVVSLDAVDQPTYESIRIGSKLDVVLENLERFQAYTARHGYAVNLAHCLMTSNWRGFPDFLRFAEARDLQAYVNTVTHPASLSMFHLSRRRLAEVVETYEAVDADLRGELVRNRDLWIDQLDRLRHRLAGLQDGEGVDYYLGLNGFKFVDAQARPEIDRMIAVGSAQPGDSVVEIVTDLDLVITGIVGDPAAIEGVDLQAVVGRKLDDLRAVLAETFGSLELTTIAEATFTKYLLEFSRPESPRLSCYLVPTRDEDGVLEAFACIAVIAPAGHEQHAPDPLPVVSVPERDAVQPDSAARGAVVDAFHARHPSVHQVVIDGDGLIASVVPDEGPLGALLEDAVGSSADQLIGVFEAELGPIDSIDQVLVPGAPAEPRRAATSSSTETLAMTEVAFRATFSGPDGRVSVLDALYLLEEEGASVLIGAGEGPASGSGT